MLRLIEYFRMRVLFQITHVMAKFRCDKDDENALTIRYEMNSKSLSTV